MVMFFYRVVNKTTQYIKSYFAFLREKSIYGKMCKKEKSPFIITLKDENRRLSDRFENAGNVDGHYFIQDMYMARRVIESGTQNHYDVGSRIDGFISHLLSSSINVTMIDIRPLPFEVDNLHFFQGNATDLNNINSNSIGSLSSLHAIEHFGLGRYGDPIDVNGWKKALKEYQRVVSEGGYLYLSVPIGPRNMLCFNAHRIFSPDTIVRELPNMKLVEFSYIKEMKLYTLDDPSKYDEEENYLCGLFIFQK